MNSRRVTKVELRVYIVDFGGFSATDAWRSSMQTLLVGVGCGEVLDLLPGIADGNPGLPRQGSAALGYIMPPLQGSRRLRNEGRKRTKARLN